MVEGVGNGSFRERVEEERESVELKKKKEGTGTAVKT